MMVEDEQSYDRAVEAQNTFMKAQFWKGKKPPMTQEEKLIRARQAAAKEWPLYADDYLTGRLDNNFYLQFAIRIFDHLDEPIVDPDVIEARKMNAEWYPDVAGHYLAGDYDTIPRMQKTLAAIKLGRKLERGE